MKFLDRYFWLPFTLTLITIGPVVALSDVSIETIKAWQTLIAGLLALAGAVLVLVAARWETNVAKRIAEDYKDRRCRTARMYVASELEAFCNRCDQIVIDIMNYSGSGGGMGKAHVELPSLNPTNVAEIGSLPEAEQFFRFATNISRINEDASTLYEISETTDGTLNYIRIRAASSAVRAYEFRNQLARFIGWHAMSLADGKLNELRKIATEASPDDAANLPD